MISDSARPAGSPPEVLARLLDASAALLASERAAAMGLPDDELHREILLPLLPAMLADAALRQHWLERAGAGFLPALRAHLDSDAPAPRWGPGDFEIHVTTSYAAGPDARALADTLLSEEPLRALAADVMNRVLDVVWPELPREALTAESIEAAEPAEAIEPSAEPEPTVAGAPEVSPTAPAPLELAPVSLEADEVPPGTEEAAPEIDLPTILDDLAPAAGFTASHFGSSPVSPPEPKTRPCIRPKWLNPLAGTRHSFGGMGAADWRKENPLRSGARE